MNVERPVIDVSRLPAVVFGHRAVPWWSTVTFMVVEGTSLGVALVVYYYVRLNFDAWPPPPAPLPSLIVPAIGLALLLAQMAPMKMAARRAHDVDARGIIRWLTVALLIGLAAAVVRALEFDAVNVRWDQDAYGSAVWLILGLHGALLAVDVLETAVILAIFARGRDELKHYSDVEDAALYQYFLSLAWVPLWFTVYLGPRIL